MSDIRLAFVNNLALRLLVCNYHSGSDGNVCFLHVEGTTSNVQTIAFPSIYHCRPCPVLKKESNNSMLAILRTPHYSGPTRILTILYLSIRPLKSAGWDWGTPSPERVASFPSFQKQHIPGDPPQLSNCSFQSALNWNVKQLGWLIW